VTTRPSAAPSLQTPVPEAILWNRAKDNHRRCRATRIQGGAQRHRASGAALRVQPRPRLGCRSTAVHARRVGTAPADGPCPSAAAPKMSAATKLAERLPGVPRNWFSPTLTKPASACLEQKTSKSVACPEREDVGKAGLATLPNLPGQRGRQLLPPAERPNPTRPGDILTSNLLTAPPSKPTKPPRSLHPGLLLPGRPARGAANPNGIGPIAFSVERRGTREFLSPAQGPRRAQSSAAASKHSRA